MGKKFNWNGEIYTMSNRIQTSVREHLINKVCFYPEMSVLDVGCGSGNLTLILAKQVPKGNVIGIDSSKSMIQQAEKTLMEQDVQNPEYHLYNRR